VVELSEDTSLKINFNRKRVTQFWLFVQHTYPALSIEAFRVLLPFTSSYICEAGFSAMVGMKAKLRNKLQLSNSLRLKMKHIDVDVSAVTNTNRKQENSFAHVWK
jgi:hypothetical protein